MKAIPKTDIASCVKYHSHKTHCNCADFTNRGGSYYHPKLGSHGCKHMIALVEGTIDNDQVRAIESGMTTEEYIQDRKMRVEALFARFA